MAITFEREKFKELILLFADASEEDPKFGATKLNKLLFYADFESFARLGRPLTGATYQVLRNGPAPAQLLQAERELEREGAIELIARPHYGRRQKRIRALRQPRWQLFSEEEQAQIRTVLDELHDLGAVDVSKRSHLLAAWKFGAPGDTIPYEAIFVSLQPATEDDLARGEELAREHGWD